MISIYLMFVVLWTEVLGHETILAINSGGLENTIISTKYVNYTSDSYYDETSSRYMKKRKIPDTITNLADRELIKNHRMAREGHKEFAYEPVVDSQGQFAAIFVFIERENEHSSKGERVFNLKLGDEVIHTIDIIREAGPNRILHKFVQFTIRDNIVYINQSHPALNAYNYKTHKIKFIFESVKGKPKVQAFHVVQGSDLNSYISGYLQSQIDKNVLRKQYVVEGYRKIPHKPYFYLSQSDIVIPPKSQLAQFIDKFITLKSIGCIFCAIFAIYNDQILAYAKKKYEEIRTRNSKETPKTNKKKPQ